VELRAERRRMAMPEIVVIVIVIGIGDDDMRRGPKCRTTSNRSVRGVHTIFKEWWIMRRPSIHLDSSKMMWPNFV